jgi:hypothetical protein
MLQVLGFFKKSNVTREEILEFLNLIKKFQRSDMNDLESDADQSNKQQLALTILEEKIKSTVDTTRNMKSLKEFFNVIEQ